MYIFCCAETLLRKQTLELSPREQSHCRPYVLKIFEIADADQKKKKEKGINRLD